MKKFAKVLSLALVLCFCIALFAGCTPSTAEKMKARYEGKGYTVEVIDESMLALSGMDLEWALMASKDDQFATVYCFKSEDDAKELVNEASSQAEEGYSYFRSGKVVVAGTTDAVKVAK